eukprot:TRINITY_DN335_c1_g1_i1.p1 TRINITY_DN335_c1_g1~~TRINITY_DN335_c1_g1_i1.p1  ORF type:complete len:617 (-),score=82.83 TRINITY_DN335_c1_g1_i1:74-1900(-)
MVLFRDFYAAAVQRKPEWSNRFLDFAGLHSLCAQIKHRVLTGETVLDLLEPVVKEAPDEEGFDAPLLISVPRAPSAAGLDSPPEERFLELLREEIDKVSTFFTETLKQYQDYFDQRSHKWATAGYSTDKVRANMRYLSKEISMLQMYHDSNLLAMKKLILKYNHRMCTRPILEGDFVDVFAVRAMELTDFTKRMQLFYAQTFKCDFDQAKANLMHSVLPPIRVLRIGIFGGWLLPCLYFLYHLVHELNLPDEEVSELLTVMPVYRFFGILVAIMISWSIVLYCLQRFRINHVFILDLSPVRHLTWLHVADVASCLLAFWLFCVVLFVRTGIKPTASVEDLHWSQPVFTVIMVTGFLGFLFLPLKRAFHTSRWYLLNTLGNILILPFGKRVKFRQFFVTDWLTSMSQSIADLFYTACYFANADLDAESLPQCTSATAKWKHVLLWLPFFWRLCQCGKMYLLTQNRLHLLNAGKYTVALIYIILTALYTVFPALEVPVILMRFASQIYSFTWDVYIDWGWIKGKNRNRMFPKLWVYGLAIFLNFVGRFLWVTSLAKLWKWPEIERWFFALLEIARRAHWSVYRLENEHCNNIEKYRRVDYVPDVGLAEYD